MVSHLFPRSIPDTPPDCVTFMSISISEPLILFVRQVLKRSPLPFLLIQPHFVPPHILPPQQNEQTCSNHDHQGIASHNSFPHHRIMLSSRLAFDPKGPNNVPNAIHHKDACRHKALLCVARNVCHSHTDNQARHRRKEPYQGISRQRRARFLCPRGLPNHHNPSYDRQTAADDHNQSYVPYLHRQEADGQNTNEADSAERHLPQQCLIRRVPKRADDERTESRHRAVDCIRRSHHDTDHPHLMIPECFKYLFSLDLLTPYAHLPTPQSLNCHSLLFLGIQKWRWMGRIREEEEEDAV